MFSEVRLIPDRNGILRRPSKMYNGKNRLFRTAIGSSIYHFPHLNVERLPLNRIGVRCNISKQMIHTCIKRFESDYQSSECDKQALYARAQPMWDVFIKDIGNWSDAEIERLRTCHFVPVSRYEAYEKSLGNSTTCGFIATMQEAITSDSAPIAWTQRSVLSIRPPEPVAKFLLPTVPEVVKHLLALQSEASPKCKCTHRRFFAD